MQLVRRAQWGARPAKSRTTFHPGGGTTLHWEGPHMGAFGHDQCAAKVRGIQNYHMDAKKWSDIAYTAVVCPHGYVYEGRWLGVRTGANGTEAGNAAWYAVCYLGGEGDGFTSEAKRAFVEVCDHLRSHGGAGPRVNVHRDHKSTACPGEEITAWVRNGMPLSQTQESDELTPEQDMILKAVWNAVNSMWSQEYGERGGPVGSLAWLDRRLVSTVQATVKGVVEELQRQGGAAPAQAAASAQAIADAVVRELTETLTAGSKG